MGMSFSSNTVLGINVGNLIVINEKTIKIPVYFGKNRVYNKSGKLITEEEKFFVYSFLNKEFLLWHRPDLVDWINKQYENILDWRELEEYIKSFGLKLFFNGDNFFDTVMIGISINNLELGDFSELMNLAKEVRKKLTIMGLESTKLRIRTISNVDF